MMTSDTDWTNDKMVGGIGILMEYKAIGLSRLWEVSSIEDWGNTQWNKLSIKRDGKIIF